jgi:hypothetical protein
MSHLWWSCRILCCVYFCFLKHNISDAASVTYKNWWDFCVLCSLSVCAFHIKYYLMKLDAYVGQWAVNVIELSRTKHHLDCAALRMIWEKLGRWVGSFVVHLNLYSNFSSGKCCSHETTTTVIIMINVKGSQRYLLFSNELFNTCIYVGLCD